MRFKGMMGNKMPKIFNQIFFVWHPNDDEKVKPYYDYFLENLSRDVLRPMSRAINFPVFYRTSSTCSVPKPILSYDNKNIIFCFSSMSVVADDKKLPGTGGCILIWSRFVARLPVSISSA
jgi:hypothetical protein